MVKVGGWGLRPVGGPLRVGGDQNRQCMVLPEISFPTMHFNKTLHWQITRE